MPELPEVELVSRSLKTLVSGRMIRSAELRRERLAPDSTPAEFAAKIGGATIDNVGRRGKHILVELDNGRTLIVHLRMTGRFSLLAAESEDPKFSHAVFHFSEYERLVFDDQRHFGLMKLVETRELSAAKELAKLAPEPFSDDFSLAYLRTALSASRRSLKEFLLDQTKVCGLGNIYAAEAMFAARIDPRVPTGSLSAKKAGRLFDSIRGVLGQAMDEGSVAAIDPENIDGRYISGSGERGWLVYGRKDQPCVNCYSPIVRLIQGGRSTFYCAKCQRP
ncbi:MAG: bifunctional DNA-formamidopyrimidine glycosylase/DNA-(apurinic or apyrimidinic site) lyase [Acidobacteriota bacterium]